MAIFNFNSCWNSFIKNCWKKIYISNDFSTNCCHDFHWYDYCATHRRKSTIKAVTSAFIFVVTVILLEYFQLKSNTFEKFITGKSKVVIEDGRLNIENLTKLRLTVDQLEMRLRNQGISKIADVKTATLEPNGQLGYELKDEAKPLTVRDFHKIMQSYNQSLDDVHNEQRESNNIFQEVKTQAKIKITIVIKNLNKNGSNIPYLKDEKYNLNGVFLA